MKNIPLSPIEQQFWHEQQLFPESPALNIGGYTQIDGHIDASIFQKSFMFFLMNNDAFCRYFPHRDMANINSFPDYTVKVLHQSDEDSLEWMQNAMRKPFDIGHYPLFEVNLLYSNAHTYFFARVHHLITDSWGLSLFLQTISMLYNHYRQFETFPASTGRIPYRDCIEQILSYAKSTHYEADKTYWLGKFSSVPPPLFDQKEPKHAEAIRNSFSIPRETFNDLEAFAHRNDATVFHYFLGALYLCLAQHYAQTDLVVGINLLNRFDKRQKQTIGTFFNTLPLQVSLQQDEPFEKLIYLIHKTLRCDYRHARFPSREMASMINNAGLFDIIFSYEHHHYAADFDHFATQSRAVSSGMMRSKIDIHVRYYSHSHNVDVDIEYNACVFSPLERQALTDSFKGFIYSPLSTLNSQTLLDRISNGKIILGHHDTIPTLFEHQVSCTPHRCAVVINQQTYTYEALNTRSNRVAHALREQGVGVDTLVAILFDYSLEMIVAILGILKAGGAYLPINPSDPETLITHRIDHSQAKIVLRRLPVHGNPQNPPHINKPSDLAYVIYTSGSTGDPKGVLLEHKGVINVLHHWVNAYDLAQNPATLLQLSDYTHDVFTGNWVKTLLTGGTLIIPTGLERKDIGKLAQLMSSNRVSMLDTTPAIILRLIAYIEENRLESASTLTHILLGSDLCHLEDYRKLAETFKGQAQVINTYGVTEATIYSCEYQAPLNEIPLNGATPIGKPFCNTQLFVLDETLTLLPLGVEGDLYLGGDGLARGYLNRPDLTTERFIVSPFDANERLYATGDRAKWSPDGNLIFLGRRDFQVKISGYRVDIEEIENTLRQHPLIEEALVVGVNKDTNRQTLTAFFVSTTSIAEETLRQYLSDKLPRHMIPTRYIFNTSLPLNASGKVDRKTLHDKANQHQHPDTPTEMTPEQIRIQQLWETVLHQRPIDLNDDVFERGADSLDCVNVLSQMNKEGGHLTLADLYHYRTVADLAKFAGRHQTSIRVDFEAPILESDVVDAQTSKPLIHSLFQQETTYYQQLLSRPVSRVFSPLLHKNDHRIFAREVYFAKHLIFENADPLRLINAINGLLMEQSLLRSTFTKKNDEYVWTEYLHQNLTHVPFLDLSDYSPAWIKSFWQNILTPYYEDINPLRKLPFRFALIKHAQKAHSILFLMDESIHDTFGEDIICQTLQDLYSQTRNPTPQPRYEDYLKHLQSKGSLSTELNNLFKFQQHVDALMEVRQHLQAYPVGQTFAHFSIPIDVPEKCKPLTKWEIAIHIFAAFLRAHLPMQIIPFFMVDDCRRFSHDQFVNTIGGFGDYRPLLLDVSKNNATLASSLHETLQHYVHHEVHFLSLLEQNNLPPAYQDDASIRTATIFFRFNAHYSRLQSDELHDSITHQKHYGHDLQRWGEGLYFFVYFKDDQPLLTLRTPFKVSANEIRQLLCHD